MDDLDSRVGCYYNLPKDEKRDLLEKEYRELLNEAKSLGIDLKVMGIYTDSVNKYKFDKAKNSNGKPFTLNENEMLEFILDNVRTCLDSYKRKQQEKKYTITAEELRKREVADHIYAEELRKRQSKLPLNLPRSFRLQHLI